MKRIVILSILVILLVGCSKDQKTINKLEGTWELVSYNQLYIDGLTSVFESTGEMTFSSYKIKKVKEDSYSRTQKYTSNGIPQNIEETGNYSVNENGGKLILKIKNSDGTYLPDLILDINTLTSTDLKIVGVINDINQTFIYKKKRK